MRKITLALALAAALLPVAAQAQVEDKLVYVAGDDAEMNAAIAKGRRTLPDFFAHLARPASDERNFSVKYDLRPEPDKVEYIWAEVISHDQGVTIARLSNTPYDTRWSLGEKVSIPDSDVIDWGYSKGKVMQGNFTTRVLLGHVDPAEAQEIRTSLGW